MEPMRGQDFVHKLMVKVNRISIAGVLTLVAIYGLLTYQRTTATQRQGPGTSGAAHLTTTGISACAAGSGSTDGWPLPVRRGPR
jgi:hypothetical protein